MHSEEVTTYLLSFSEVFANVEGISRWINIVNLMQYGRDLFIQVTTVSRVSQGGRKYQNRVLTHLVEGKSTPECACAIRAMNMGCVDVWMCGKEWKSSQDNHCRRLTLCERGKAQL